MLVHAIMYATVSTLYLRSSETMGGGKKRLPVEFDQINDENIGQVCMLCLSLFHCLGPFARYILFY